MQLQLLVRSSLSALLWVAASGLPSLAPAAYKSALLKRHRGSSCAALAYELWNDLKNVPDAPTDPHTLPGQNIDRMHIYFFKAKIPLTEPDLVKAFFLQSDDDHGGGAEETAAAEAAAAAAEAAAAARGVEDAERQENEDAESYEAGDADFHYATVGVSLRSRPGWQYLPSCLTWPHAQQVRVQFWDVIPARASGDDAHWQTRLRIRRKLNRKFYSDQTYTSKIEYTYFESSLKNARILNAIGDHAHTWRRNESKNRKSWFAFASLSLFKFLDRSAIGGGTQVHVVNNNDDDDDDAED